MTEQTQLESLRRVVAAGDRLRADLERGLLRADLERDLRAAGPGERGPVATELMMFYGQAFAEVLHRLPAPLKPGGVAAGVLLEAAEGLTLYTLWAREDTPLDEAARRLRLGVHWGRIVAMLTAE